jgi:hypothetical protein
MGQNYLNIRNEYLDKAWSRSPEELAKCLPGELKGDALYFPAFGEPCELTREEITLSGEPARGQEGLLIALYASTVPDRPVLLQPLQSFKDLPNSMPYHGAFAANAERVLAPHVPKIHLEQERLAAVFSGHVNSDIESGDFSFTLYPLPRIPLIYIFHLPDEEFDAAVTCLFANNAAEFMPIDGLADVAEYTGNRIIRLVART